MENKSIKELKSQIIALEKENKKLFEEKEKFENFVCNSPYIFYEYSNLRGGVFWSNGVKDILGYSSSELIQNPSIWENSIHPDESKEITNAIKLFSDEGEYYLKYRIKTKKGKWTWLHDQFINKRSIGNEIIISRFATDITSINTTNTELRESEERFKTLFQDGKLVMLIIDPKSKKIIDANIAAQKFYGYDNIKSMTIDQINTIPLSEIEEKIQQVISQKSHQFQFVHKLANGDLKTVEAFPTLLKFKSGNLFLLVIIDISERIESDRAYRDSLNEIDIISSNVPNILWKAEVSNSNELINTYISDVADDLLILPKGTINNDWNKYFSYVKPEYIPQIMGTIEKGIKNINTKQSIDYEIIKSNGDEAWFSSTGKVVNKDGSKKLYGVTIDITDRIKKETALKQSEKLLRELNLTKDKFFSIIAHDLRSPFNAILGFSELILNKASEKNDPELINYSSALFSSAQKSFELLNNLLDWSRIQTGKLKFSPKLINISEITTNILELLTANIVNKNLIVKTAFESDLFVFADKQMIETVIRNLVSNAIKYTPVGGKINIVALKNEKEIEFSIKNSGIGIEKSDMEKLFNNDEFFSTPGTNNEKGSGLGLILCKEFIEMHSGNLTVSSEQGKTTKFTFFLPNKKSIY
ncbi:MAG: PAS domain S-box protein [Bacteroidales bacterium]|nr:PAS domain S-box protein [Bacteroidales bacterium]